MKRTALKRTTQLQAYMPLQRRAPLRSTKPLEQRVVATVGEPQAKRKRPRYTGPDRSTCLLVDRRSGRTCEWPGCTALQTDRHHRLNRKQGGRHGEAQARVNGAAWLLAACRVHHAYVTSPFGERREVAIRLGWLLLEHQDAPQAPVLTRHHQEPVWLDNDGNWHEYAEGAA